MQTQEELAALAGTIAAKRIIRRAEQMRSKGYNEDEVLEAMKRETVRAKAAFNIEQRKKGAKAPGESDLIITSGKPALL